MDTTRHLPRRDRLIALAAKADIYGQIHFAGFCYYQVADPARAESRLSASRRCNVRSARLCAAVLQLALVA